jgi:hypothetical protein
MMIQIKREILSFIICAAIILSPPAAWAENAHQKFNVFLQVSASEPIKTVVESYVKKELALLGDVAVVDSNEDYRIAVAVAQNPDIRRIFSFATVFMENSAWGLLFKNLYAHFSMPNHLKLTCQEIVVNFNRQILEPLRQIGPK